MERKRKNHIARWRVFKQLKQEELLEKLAAWGERNGVAIPATAASLSRIENGSQNYTIDFLEALVDSLATGEDDPTIADLLNTNPFEGMLDITRSLEKLNQRQLRMARDVIEAMVRSDQQEFKEDDKDD